MSPRDQGGGRAGRAVRGQTGGTRDWRRYLAGDAHGGTRPARRWSVSARGHGRPSAGVQDGSFDAVVCQLGLQFFPDPARSCGVPARPPCRRVVPQSCVISTPDRAPMWGVFADALSRHLPDQREALHLSFALADPERLEHLLRMAGFRDVRVQARDAPRGPLSRSTTTGPRIEAGTGQLPQAYSRCPNQVVGQVREEVQARLAEFESGGRLVMSVEMLIGQAGLRTAVRFSVGRRHKGELMLTTGPPEEALKFLVSESVKERQSCRYSPG